jgi:hypothetical protein
MCGTKSSTSTRNDRRQTMKVMMLIMKTMSKYRDECDGAWKWAVTARINMIKVSSAATGCRTRMADRVVRVDEGRSKVAESSGEKMVEVSYPISTLLQPSGPQYPNTPKLTPRKLPSGMA